MRAGFRLRLGLDSIMMDWCLIERRVFVASRLRLSSGLASIMIKLIMMVWGLIEHRVLGGSRLRTGLRLWMDFATHKLCLGIFGFDRRVNFITDINKE